MAVVKSFHCISETVSCPQWHLLWHLNRVVPGGDFHLDLSFSSQARSSSSPSSPTKEIQHRARRSRQAGKFWGPGNYDCTNVVLPMLKRNTYSHPLSLAMPGAKLAPSSSCNTATPGSFAPQCCEGCCAVHEAEGDDSCSLHCQKQNWGWYKFRPDCDVPCVWEGRLRGDIDLKADKSIDKGAVAHWEPRTWPKKKLEVEPNMPPSLVASAALTNWGEQAMWWLRVIDQWMLEEFIWTNSLRVIKHLGTKDSVLNLMVFKETLEYAIFQRAQNH